MPALSYVDIWHARSPSPGAVSDDAWGPAPKCRALSGSRPKQTRAHTPRAALGRNAVPSEIWTQVLTHVSKEDLLQNVAGVSQYWRALALQPLVLAPKLWRPIRVPSGAGRGVWGADVLAQARAETKLVRQVRARPMVLQPEAGSVRAVSFTPDSHKVFIVSDAGQVAWHALIDLRARKRVPPPWYGVHTLRRAHSVRFSPDARCALMGSNEGVIAVWPGPNAPHFTQVGNAVVKPRFYADFAPDAARIVTVNDDDSLAIWALDAVTQPAAVLPRPPVRRVGYLCAVRWSAGGEVIAGLTAYGHVFVWDASAPNKPPARLPTSDVSSIATSHNGRWIAAGYQHGRLRLFASRGATQAAAVARPTRSLVQTLVFSPDDHVVAAGDGQGQLSLWSWHLAKAPQPYAKLLGHRKGVRAVTFNQTQTLVMSASDDGDVRIWPMIGFDQLRPVLDARSSMPA